jgi:hypothetical protein
VRTKEISFLNTVLCLLVMLIHICSPAIVGLQKESLQFACIFFPWRASAFVVQGFLFLSALKFFRGKKDAFSYGTFLWGRIKKIGFPYIVATVLSYFGLIYLGYYAFDLHFLLKSLGLGNMISPFYFIIILFQFYLLMPLWRKMVEKVDFWVMAIVSILLMRLFHQGLPSMIQLISPETAFPYNDRVFTSYLAYWILGCYAGDHYDTFRETIGKNRNIILGGAGLFLAADVLLAYANTRGLIRVSFLEDVHTLYVFFAILAFYWLGLQLSEKFFKLPFMKEVDGSSFYIYLYHGILLYFIQDRVLNPLGIGLSVGFFIRWILCWGIAFAVSWGAAYWKKRGEKI